MNLHYPLRFSRWYKLLPSLSLTFTTTKKELWLTFDDGPVSPETNWTLETLAKFNVPATFFVLTERAIGERKLLREISAQGHEIALHSWHHRRQLFANHHQIFSEWIDSRNRIENILGKKINRFRPPYAVPPLLCWSKLLNEGLKPVYLTWMVGDYVPDLDATGVVKQLRKKVEQGNILLLHDGGPAPHIFRTILPDLLTQFTNDGWQFIIPTDQQLL